MENLKGLLTYGEEIVEKQKVEGAFLGIKKENLVVLTLPYKEWSKRPNTVAFGTLGSGMSMSHKANR